MAIDFDAKWLLFRIVWFRFFWYDFAVFAFFSENIVRFFGRFDVYVTATVGFQVRFHLKVYKKDDSSPI